MSNETVVVPEGQVEDLVQPIAKNTRYVDAGVLSFGVEFRELNARVIRETYGHNPEAMKFFETMMDIDDIGITLHVYSREEASGNQDGLAERLRFDAFGDHPHYHYVFPDGTHKRMDYDVAACGDMLPWALGRMEERLPEMLGRAGAADVADALDLGEFRAAIPEILATADRLLAERGGEHAE